MSTLDTAPSASVVVDVGPDRDEDDIFRAMRATTRRRVRQARREGICVRWGGANDLPALQAIIEATARRQGFRPYPADYYRRLWDIFGASGHARLLIAEHEGVPLSGMLLIAFGNTVIYKIGGWAGVAGSPHGSSELMRWTAIAWAHDAGYRHYDFEGIPINIARAVRLETLSIPSLRASRSSSSDLEATLCCTPAPTTFCRKASPAASSITFCHELQAGGVSHSGFPDAHNLTGPDTLLVLDCSFAGRRRRDIGLPTCTGSEVRVLRRCSARERAPGQRGKHVSRVSPRRSGGLLFPRAFAFRR